MGITNNNKYSVFRYRISKKVKVNNSCAKCDVKFKPGDRIFNKRGSKRKAYHDYCWELLLH